MIDLSPQYRIPIMILALLIAIIGHEIMHGFVALKYGDTTARDEGRLSINPLIHIDLVGSILLPAMLFLLNAPFLFGWAKPVPVRMDIVIRNGGYFGAFCVSLAGIAYNFALSLVASVVIFALNSSISADSTLSSSLNLALFLSVFFLIQLIIYNVILGVFNLFPIPPLDGSNALAYLGLIFKNDFFVRLFSRIPPIVGMIFLMLVLSTSLSNYIFAPAQYIINFLLL